MPNYIQKKDRIAFHPGYYVKELIDSNGLTQEDFAKRIGTTPKNISKLVNGEQRLSIEMSMKLARFMGTSVEYWLNLQNAFDALLAEFESDEELERERTVFRALDYRYFREHWGAPAYPRQVDLQIQEVRSFLGVASLTVLEKPDLAVSFRSVKSGMNESNIIRANTLVQIAVNEALKIKAPKYNRSLFRTAANHALTLTRDHDGFYPILKEKFLQAGVIFVVLPNLPGSKINGATKIIGDSVMLMVNDRRLDADTFWFTLFHEVGHIMHGDFGISFDDSVAKSEDGADKFASNCLVPPEEYQEFVYGLRFNPSDIEAFSEEIGRDPGIVLGRLQHDGYVDRRDTRYNYLRHKYKVLFVDNQS